MRAGSLTPDGGILLEHARRILDEVEDARNLLSHATQPVSASFVYSHIVPFVPECLRLSPDVTPDLYSTDAVVKLIGGNVRIDSQASGSACATTADIIR